MANTTNIGGRRGAAGGRRGMTFADEGRRMVLL